MKHPHSTVKAFDVWVQGKTNTIHFGVMTSDEATDFRLTEEYKNSW